MLLFNDQPGVRIYNDRRTMHKEHLAAYYTSMNTQHIRVSHI